MSNKISVLVYGSLREGFGNHRLLEHPDVEKGSRGMIKGFAMYSFGMYPMCSVSPDDTIFVENYLVPEEVFIFLDRLEGYPSFYNRKQVEYKDMLSWIYFGNKDQVRGLPKVEEGIWQR